MELSVFVIIITVIVAATVIWLLVGKSRGTDNGCDGRLVDALKRRISDFENQVDGLTEQLTASQADNKTLTTENAVLRTQCNGLRAEIENVKKDRQDEVARMRQNFDERNRQQEQAFERQMAQLSLSHRQMLNQRDQSHQKELAQVRAACDRMMEQMRQATSRQIEQLKESNDRQLQKLQELNTRQVESQLNLIKEQMRTTSEEVLKRRQAELSEQNVDQVSKIIDPLMDSLKGMKEAFDDSKEKQREALTRLDETIRLNTRKNESLGQTADRLARALTGEVKAQGNFGELKLKQLLEDLELHEGEQYDTQTTLRDVLGRRQSGDDGKGLVPDFILHFPNNRHVVIDSKMSLTAYERYMNTDEDDTEGRREALAAHIASVRGNMAKLAKKSYSQYLPEGVNRLDFAFMYVPIEAALNLALLNDNTLWRDAYDRGVIILGPQTMYMNLRVLEMMWTQVRQLENQQTMIECANLVVERVQDFAIRFKEVDSSMRDVIKKMDKFNITTGPTGHSIITAAQRLIKTGAKENRNKAALDKSESLFIDSDKSSLLADTAADSAPDTSGVSQ